MSDPKLLVRPPDPARDTKALLDLVSKTFGNYSEFHEYCREYYLLNSFYDWNASRVGEIDGQLVTHFGVWDYQMRIGTASVRTAGVGVVATHADYRKRGLMELTAADSVSAMRNLGYDFSILFGIWNYYHQFGYTRAWPETVYKVQTGLLPVDPLDAKLQTFDPGTRPEFETLYNLHHHGLTGTAVRPTFLRPPVKSRRPLGLCWNGSDSKPAGYLLLHDRGAYAEVFEAVGEPQSLIRAVAAKAREWGADEIRFPFLHWHSKLARWLRSHTCKIEFDFVRNGSAMGRLINLHSLLSKLTPELTRRLRASHLRDYTGDLLLDFTPDAGVSTGLANPDKPSRVSPKDLGPRQRVTLQIAKAKVQIKGNGSKNTLRAGDELAMLLLGAESVDELISRTSMKCTGRAKELAQVLFPPQHPMLGVMDRF